MHAPTPEEVAARMAAAGITGLKPDDLAWLTAAAARTFTLPAECPVTTVPAPVFVPLMRDHE
ncbi:MAG TPA: hypothetical protein VGN52_09800 [Burkholderiales bacterium]|jgi:hypothetical protein